jgi:acyl carrier protein
MKNYNRQKLLEVMEQNGIFINDNDVNGLYEALEIDSITFVTMIIDIEQIFGITFDDSDYEKMTNKDNISTILLEETLLYKIANS